MPGLYFNVSSIRDFGSFQLSCLCDFGRLNPREARGRVYSDAFSELGGFGNKSAVSPQCHLPSNFRSLRLGPLRKRPRKVISNSRYFSIDRIKHKRKIWASSTATDPILGKKKVAKSMATFQGDFKSLNNDLYCLFKCPNLRRFGCGGRHVLLSQRIFGDIAGVVGNVAGGQCVNHAVGHETIDAG
jgi:hypothetical protein